MRAVRFSVLMLTLLLLVISTASCAGGEPFDAGETLSASDVAALRESLLGEKDNTPQAPGEDPAPEQPATPEQPTTPENPSEQEQPSAPEEPTPQATVFWLSGGSVYHTDSECRYIKGKQNVQSGTVSEASDAGKARACSSCAAD